MIAEGNYKCRIVGCYLGESAEKKTPYFALELRLESGEQIDFVAWLTEKTTASHFTALVECGFLGTKLEDLANPKLTVPDLFESKEVNAMVGHETYISKTGEEKVKAVVKFLGDGNSGLKRFTHEEAIVKFKSYSFNGELMSIMKNMGIKKPAPKVEVVKDFEESELPF